MSSSPECRRCGHYIHHGLVTCDGCDDRDAVDRERARMARAIGHYAAHAAIDLKSPKEIQDDLRAIAGWPHTHIASIGSDDCDLCGHNFRHDIHHRIARKAA